jgi:ribA/ribD-fused uncharacterized protein
MNSMGKYKIEEKEIRIYKKEDSAIFKKNKDEFGDLSNMATGFPLLVNNVKIRTTEALYQACRFPHLPDIQKKIIDQSSPMNVKIISNANKKASREDWDEIRLKIMKWCINVKLAQNFITFGAALHKTGLKSIVENSSKDNFWGAIPNNDATIFIGKNALGRLLMDLRQTFYGKDSYSLLYVKPPSIENLLLLSQPIALIDERKNFVQNLKEYWDEIKSGQSKYEAIDTVSSVAEETSNYKTPSKSPKKKKSKEDNHPKLFDDLTL